VPLTVTTSEHQRCANHAAHADLSVCKVDQVDRTLAGGGVSIY
jgi:hypothetical protein